MTFDGFSRAGLAFLADLAQNNNRQWFEARRARYENALLAPAQAFVEALGERLREIAPHIRFDARSNGGSLMRIHRVSTGRCSARPISSTPAWRTSRSWRRCKRGS